MLGALLKSRSLWAFLVLAGLGAGAAGALVWRLDQGPIPLAFLDHHIADAISGLAPGITAEVGATALARAGRGAALRVSGVRLLTRDGTPVLSLPAIVVRPSFAALLAGKIVLARVDVDDAELVLTRQPDGTWLLGSNTGDAGVPVLELFGTPAAEGRREQGLPRVVLSRTHVTIDDQRAGGSLDLTDGDLVISPRDGQLDVTVSAALQIESTVPPAPGRLALPIQAEASIALSDAGDLGAVSFTFLGGAGELVPKGDTGLPFAIAGLDGAGSYAPDVETLRFDKLEATIGASSVALQATALLGAEQSLGLDGTVDALAVRNLTRLWPATLVTTVRTWLVTNLSAGTLRRCHVRLGTLAATAPVTVATAPAPSAASSASGAGSSTSGAASPGPAAAASPSSLAASPAFRAGPAASPARTVTTPASAAKGKAPAVPPPPDTAGPYEIVCGFDGVSADYLRPLDPIRAAKGSARLTATRLVVDVNEGQVGACRVETGKLVMDLSVDPPRADIHADVSGNGADVLALVDRPPLRLVTPLGIAPKDLGGRSRVHAKLTLPIRASLTAAEVTVSANAELTGASLPPLLGGIGIKDGDLDVRIEGNVFEVKGKTVIVGIPAVTKPVVMKVVIAPMPGGTKAKPAPNAGQQVKVTLDGDGVIARGSANVVGGTVTALDVERLKLGDTDVAGTLQRRPAGGYDATLTGASLDLATLLTDPRLVATDRAEIATSYSLALKLGSVRVAPDLEIRGLQGSVQGTGGQLGAAALTGSVAPSGDFQVTVEGPFAARRVQVTSDQAGALLRALGGVEQIVGGRLKLDGTTDKRGVEGLLDGKLVIRDFKIVRAPVLTKILGIGSLDGIASLVQGEGLPVTKARMPFHWENGRLRIHDVRAVGAVGLTAAGVFDQKAGTCDVRGNIIPAYTLNTALGKIPLLGRLLVGGKGQGVFGIDYRVSGKTANPSVFVNPLTSVAPTILRSWFVDPFLRDFDAPAPSPPPVAR